MTVTSIHRKTKQPNMMDYVPSMDFPQFVASPNSISIYEQEQLDMQNVTCANMAPHSVESSLSQISEEIGGLDDVLEENILTSDILNNLSMTSSLSSDFGDWGKKIIATEEGLETPNNNSKNTPTLAALNMDNSNFSLDDIQGFISEDVKPLNFLGLDRCGIQSSLQELKPVANPTSTVTSVTNSSQEVPFQMFQPAQTLPVSLSYTPKSAFTDKVIAPQSIAVVAPLRHTVQKPTVEPVVEIKKEPEVDSSYLHSLLVQKDTKPALVNQQKHPDQAKSFDVVSSSSASPLPQKRSLSLSEVKSESTDEKWKDIENFINGSPPTKKRKRCDSGGSGHTSDDDEDDDDDMSYKDDDSDDDMSDIDSDLGQMSPQECESLVAAGKKQKQFFWQYNVQSKGPKGTRLKLSVETPDDPHVLNSFEDPVFDAGNTAIAGIRHGGKARKGDGNEVTPNPKKLYMIGQQLLRLNRQINSYQLSADIPASQRNKSRKEKNKLASRACRLKKKAQHEANKIKLNGLEQEHSQLNRVLGLMWPDLKQEVKSRLRSDMKSHAVSSKMTTLLETNIKNRLKGMVAGNTTNFVNDVIAKVESGDDTGGLDIKKRK